MPNVVPPPPPGRFTDDQGNLTQVARQYLNNLSAAIRALETAQAAGATGASPLYGGAHTGHITVTGGIVTSIDASS